MTRLFFISLFIFSLSVSAKDKLKTDPNCQEGELEKSAKMLLSVAEKAGGCPNPAKLKNLCNFVGKRYADEDEDSPYVYQYERMIHQAACVDMTKDSEAEIATKVQKLWNSHKESFQCNLIDFSIKNGSILKYAAAKKSYEFLDLAIDTWKVNLNNIDPDDNGTLLDYIEKEMEMYKGTHIEETMKRYHKKLRNAGAKRRSEL